MITARKFDNLFRWRFVLFIAAIIIAIVMHFVKMPQGLMEWCWALLVLTSSAIGRTYMQEVKILTQILKNEGYNKCGIKIKKDYT